MFNIKFFVFIFMEKWHTICMDKIDEVDKNIAVITQFTESARQIAKKPNESVRKITITTRLINSIIPAIIAVIGKPYPCKALRYRIINPKGI